jgi:hypothetical protein
VNDVNKVRTDSERARRISRRARNGSQHMNGSSFSFAFPGF